jgi:hypothetical protein
MQDLNSDASTSKFPPRVDISTNKKKCTPWCTQERWNRHYIREHARIHVTHESQKLDECANKWRRAVFYYVSTNFHEPVRTINWSCLRYRKFGFIDTSKTYGQKNRVQVLSPSFSTSMCCKSNSGIHMPHLLVVSWRTSNMRLKRNQRSCKIRHLPMVSKHYETS